MKQFIKWLISTGGLAWTVIIVVLAQSFHYYAFFYSFKMFNGIINHGYSLFLTIVFSLPLLIFTAKLGSITMKFGEVSQFKLSELEEKYKGAVNLYTWLDIIINIYTWYIQLELFSNFKYIFIPKYFVATIIAIVLPLTLKRFAGELKIK